MRNKIILGMASAGILLTVACAQKVDKEPTFEELNKPIVTNELMEAKVNEVITNRSEAVIKSIESQLNAQVKAYVDEGLSDGDKESLIEKGTELKDVEMLCDLRVSELSELAKENIQALDKRMAEKVDTAVIEAKLEEKEVNGKVDVIKLNTVKAEATQYVAKLSLDCVGNNDLLTVKSSASKDISIDLDKINGAVMKDVIIGKATPAEKAALIKKAKANIVNLKFIDAKQVEVISTTLIESANINMTFEVTDDQVVAIEAKESECNKLANTESTSEAIEIQIEEKLDLCEEELAKLKDVADMGRFDDDYALDGGFIGKWFFDRNSLTGNLQISVALDEAMLKQVNISDEPINVADLKALAMMTGPEADVKDYKLKAISSQKKAAADINNKIAQKKIVGKKLVDEQAQAEADAAAQAAEEKAAQEAAAELEKEDSEE